MNRATIVLLYNHLRQLLNLHENVELVALTVSHDPVELRVHVRGDRFTPTHPEAEAPCVKLWECQPIPEKELLRMAGVGQTRTSATPARVNRKPRLNFDDED